MPESTGAAYNAARIIKRHATIVASYSILSLPLARSAEFLLGQFKTDPENLGIIDDRQLLLVVHALGNALSEKAGLKQKRAIVFEFLVFLNENAATSGRKGFFGKAVLRALEKLQASPDRIEGYPDVAAKATSLIDLARQKPEILTLDCKAYITCRAVLLPEKKPDTRESVTTDGIMTDKKQVLQPVSVNKPAQPYVSILKPETFPTKSKDSQGDGGSANGTVKTKPTAHSVGGRRVMTAADVIARRNGRRHYRTPALHALILM